MLCRHIAALARGSARARAGTRPLMVPPFTGAKLTFGVSAPGSVPAICAMILAMRRPCSGFGLSILLLIVSACTEAPQPPPAVRWAKGFAPSGTSSRYLGVAAMGDGVVAVGQYEATGELPGPATRAVVVKYDSAGALQWTLTPFSEGEVSHGAAAATAPGDVVYVAGQAGAHAALARVRGEATEWVRVATGPGESQFAAVAAAADGSVYAVGTVTGRSPAVFGARAEIASPIEGASLVLVKYDASGNAVWARGVQAAQTESNYKGVAVASDGAVHAAGWLDQFDEPITLAGDTPFKGAFKVGNNALLVRYDAGGALAWHRSVEKASSHSNYFGIAGAPDGALYCIGTFVGEDRVSLGNGVSVKGHGIGATALVKYDVDGKVRWATPILSRQGGALPIALAFDGRIVVSGALHDIGPHEFGARVSLAGSPGKSTGFVAAFDPQGRSVWARSVAGGDSSLNGVAPGPAGTIYAAGWFRGAKLDVGDGVSVEGRSAENGFIVAYASKLGASPRKDPQ